MAVLAMAVLQVQYEELLSVCSGYPGALTLLKQYRPYLETLPSMRRPDESLVTIPLPNVSIRQSQAEANGPVIHTRMVASVPCDVAVLMCDPEWKIKTGVEIFIFIHRPEEEFSELLSRWRQTQRLLSGGYEWLMPRKYHHLLTEGADAPHPLFVIFPQTPPRILQGLKGAGLPVIVHRTTGGQDRETVSDSTQTSFLPHLDQGGFGCSGPTDWETQDDTLNGLE